MKFKLILLLVFVTSCAGSVNKLNSITPFNSLGFAYIYNDYDYINKEIKKKFDNSSYQISHNRLKVGSLIKVINPKTNEFMILKNIKKTNYPEFYKILITKPVAIKLNLDNNSPLVEVLEVKKNKSFIAKKSKIFTEEKKTHSNAPVESVKIDNISKNKKTAKPQVKDNFYIIIGHFYSNKSAILLKKRISDNLANFDSKKLIIKLKKTNKSTLFAGPYTSINLMKNDYIKLKEFGFEELDVSINE